MVIDEATRKETTLTGQLGVYNNDQAELTIIHEIIAECFYFLVISQSGVELAKVKLFCTAQTNLQDYQITKGAFVEPTQTDNDFIVYGN